MLKLKPIILGCALTLSAVTLSTLAQDKPPAAPPAVDSKPAPKQDAKPAVPTIADGQALIATEEFEEAAKVFHQIVKADPDNPRAWHLLGYSLHAGGDLIDAMPCHLMAAEFPQTAAVSSYNVACVYSLRGKTDKAFIWLEKSREAGFNNLEQIENDTDMDNIRKDPRFAEFLKSLQQGAPGEPMEIIELPAPDAKPRGDGGPSRP